MAAAKDGVGASGGRGALMNASVLLMRRWLRARLLRRLRVGTV